MKKIFRVIAILVAIIVVIGIIIVGYVCIALPNVGKPADIKITADSVRIVRGKYLAEHVCGCIACHSQRDFNLLNAPVIPGTYGMGGEAFLNDHYFARNITPYHLANWSDGEILRAVTEGVSKDGSPLFPLMPYLNFAQADSSDIYSIVAYIRTLQPIKNDPPASHSDFPMNIIVHTIPQKVVWHSAPQTSDTINYGKYLVTIANCADCHTPKDKGKDIPGLSFAGGMEFPMPYGGVATSANITPDKETGIGNWSREKFIQTFKMYDSSKNSTPVKKGEYNTMMPWNSFAGMKTEDLSAIYSYLRTLTPIKHSVVYFKKS